MRFKFQLFSLLFLISFNISPAQKQPLFFDKITQQNGGSLGSVTGIEQDDHGFLWFATREGLYRYDGYQTLLYKHTEGDSTSLPFNDITYMYKDREGIFWLRHYDRFVPFKNEERCFKYPAVSDLSFDFNAKLIEDTQGNLWIGPGEKGLAKFNKDSGKCSFFKHYPPVYSPKTLEKVHSCFDSSPLSRLQIHRNATDSSIHVNIDEEADFLAYSSAETNNRQIYDYGWISSGKDTIFQIDPLNTKHAGGELKNALQLQVIRLKPGKYTLHFHTDNSHSPEEWIGEPPDKIPFYGIGLVKLTPSLSHSLQNSIEKKYTPPHSISSSNIKDMMLDNEGTLWLLTDRGLERYIPEKDEFEPIPLAYEDYFGREFSADYLVFCQDNREDFWIGSQYGLVRVNLKSGNYQRYRNDENQKDLTSNLIISLFIDKQHRLWVGTDKGINLYQSPKDTFYHYQAGNSTNLYGNQITSFYQDPSDNIWVASREGLNKLQKRLFEHHYLSIDRYYAFPIVSDKQGNFWYRGENNSLLHYLRHNNTIEKHPLPKQAFPKSDLDRSRDYLMEDMVMDDAGNIWFATGNLLIGYSPDKKKVIHKQFIKAVTVNNDSLRSDIHHIEYEPNGIIRVFSLKGIYSYHIDSGKLIQTLPFDYSYESIEEVNLNYIKFVIRDREGNYWLRTAQGIYKYFTQKNELQRVYEFAPGLRGSPLTKGNLAQGPERKIWFSSFPSIIAIDPVTLKIEEFELETEKETGVSNVFPDSTGIWLYSNNGVFFYNPQSDILEEYSSKTGLADDMINGLKKDHKNNIWLTSLKGLTQISEDRASLNTYFTSNDHISYNFRNFPERVTSGEGELLIFHSNGFLSFYPDSINQHVPPVEITQFSIFGEKQAFDSLIYNKKSISLNYDQNHFSIEFAALDYSSPMEQQYLYKLEGVDKDWQSSPPYDRKASYTTVPPGHYTFRVKASNNHGIWNQKGVNLNIYIAPPWYRTKLAYSLYIIFIIAGIFIFIKLRERKLIREKRILEQKVKERTAKIEQQKEEITTQRDKIARQNKDIRDSIHYANNIQTAALPPQEQFRELLPEHFILFKPRDIVSGDFYWITRIRAKTVVVAADCTGHGVPGAFMSMLGIAFLNDIVSKISDIQASIILDHLRTRVIQLLHQQNEDSLSRDGMDLALCVVDQKKQKLQYAGANNNLYLIRNEHLEPVRADRMPIGQHINKRPFSQKELAIHKDDIIYIFSDGYVDQFSGETGKKFKTKRFKDLLLKIHKEPMHIQHDILDETIEQWKGDTEQVDDILVMGIKF